MPEAENTKLDNSLEPEKKAPIIDEEDLINEEEKITAAAEALADLISDDQEDLRIQSEAEVQTSAEQEAPEEGAVTETALQDSQEAQEAEKKESEQEKSLEEDDEAGPSGDEQEVEETKEPVKTQDLASKNKAEADLAPAEKDQDLESNQEAGKPVTKEQTKESSTEKVSNLGIEVADTKAGVTKILGKLRDGSIKPKNFHDYLALVLTANAGLGLDQANPSLKVSLSTTARQEVLQKLESFQGDARFKLSEKNLRQIPKDSPIRNLLGAPSQNILSHKEENVHKLTELKNKILEELRKEEEEETAAKVQQIKKSKESK